MLKALCTLIPMIYYFPYFNKNLYNRSHLDQKSHTSLSGSYMHQMIALSAANTHLQVTLHCPSQFTYKGELLQAPPPASHTAWTCVSHNEFGDLMVRGEGVTGHNTDYYNVIYPWIKCILKFEDIVWNISNEMAFHIA